MVIWEWAYHNLTAVWWGGFEPPGHVAIAQRGHHQTLAAGLPAKGGIGMDHQLRRLRLPIFCARTFTSTSHGSLRGPCQVPGA